MFLALVVFLTQICSWVASATAGASLFRNWTSLWWALFAWTHAWFWCCRLKNHILRLSQIRLRGLNLGAFSYRKVHCWKDAFWNLVQVSVGRLIGKYCLPTHSVSSIGEWNFVLISRRPTLGRLSSFDSNCDCLGSFYPGALVSTPQRKAFWNFQFIISQALIFASSATLSRYFIFCKHSH